MPANFEYDITSRLETVVYESHEQSVLMGSIEQAQQEQAETFQRIAGTLDAIKSSLDEQDRTFEHIAVAVDAIRDSLQGLDDSLTLASRAIDHMAYPDDDE